MKSMLLFFHAKNTIWVLSEFPLENIQCWKLPQYKINPNH